MAAQALNLDDTIAAVSTPLGEGAIGIVRLSGPEAIMIADRVFSSRSGVSVAAMKSHTLQYGWIVSDKRLDDQHRSGARQGIVDEVLVTLMRGPASFTRQDIVEINCHGGHQALWTVLEMVLKQGARLAQPGEFTRRAFLSGRLDLSQAEAVLDVIQARSEAALKVGLSQLRGDLSKQVVDLRRRMVETLAQVEVGLDFSQEEIPVPDAQNIQRTMTQISADLDALIESSRQGRIVRDGLKVAIFGRPNVGKSSLLNALLRQERAIVTEIPGTTRDTIEELVHMRGLAVRLVDTAGILAARDKIEEEALVRSRRAIEESDLVLFVVDASQPLTPQDEELALRMRGRNAVLVWNKSDLPFKADRVFIEKFFEGPGLDVSALTSFHIDRLEEEIIHKTMGTDFVQTEGIFVSHARHAEILRKAKELLDHCSRSLEEGLSGEFIAGDLRSAWETLGELTGETFREDVLDVIFSKFCIGK